MNHKQLLKWRIKNRYTQVQASNVLDVSLRQYQNYEWGNKPITRAITALVFLHDYEKNAQACNKRAT